ncbi:hypothetical protein BDZ94DRAFT_1257895 [Collybia nuda]|uniref:Uncharacterized protein n=1 Tax=Collybia nuda TaxID=64659 RepID=A0A9P5Y781_9AGAR|nr:hypothetical protein BDZ94DRAFT_1257895 [Collybia nuda]
MRTPVFVILAIAVMARAGLIDVGGPCSSMNDHLDLESRKFTSECTDQTFCSRALNGTCTPRLCRRDEYPFGFNATQEIPPQCDVGSYCPDEGRGCVPLEVAGSPCQLNRDEQCGPPPDWERLASSRNFNGSICLQSTIEMVTLRYANKTLSQSCIIENTTFRDVGPDGQEYVITVMRDNCLSHQLYCDPIELVCQRTRPVGLACTSDSVCETVC